MAALGYLGAAQAHLIELVAGNPVGDQAPATTAVVRTPLGVAVDQKGNQYIVSDGRIRKVLSVDGSIQTVAGGGGAVVEDGVFADLAYLSNVYSVTVDSSGAIFLGSGSSNGVILKVVNGIVTRYAGGGSSTANGIPARTARLEMIRGLAVDSADNLYVATGTWGEIVRKVTKTTGLISTVAGGGGAGFVDNVVATSGKLDAAHGLAIDAAGSLYIADADNHRIRKVSAATGLISTVAGNGTPGTPAGANGDGGPALAGNLNLPRGVAVDAVGNLYIADTGDQRIRKVDHVTGIMTTIAGSGLTGYFGDGGQANVASLNTPYSISVDVSGSILFSDSANHRVRKISNGIIQTLAGDGTDADRNAAHYGDGLPGYSAGFNSAARVTFDSAGNLYVADNDGYRVRKLDAATGIISTVAGNGNYCSTNPASGSLATAVAVCPVDIAIDTNDVLHISSGSRIYRLEPGAGTLTVVAGGGPCCDPLDGVAATNFYLTGAMAISFDSDNNLYFSQGARIRQIEAASRIVKTYVGTGTYGYGGDGGPATSAMIDMDNSRMRWDAVGNLYIADQDNHRIRKVDTLGIITTVAGTGVGGYNGDAVAPALAAQLKYPQDVEVDAAGNLYIADWGNDRVRKVDTAGFIQPFAGDGNAYSGLYNAVATETSVPAPSSVALDPWGLALHVADRYSRTRVKKVYTRKFLDVADNAWTVRHVYGLYGAGITTGCGGGNYCPTQAVNREQMAAFMVRAKEGEPAGNCATSPYSDVPTGSTFCKYIQRMAALGITSGCGGGKYCPTQAVDRQQMAALIVRAVEGEPVTGCTTPPFTDVATGDTFCKYIQRMVALGITSGCGGGKYCPTQAVNRETMAVFLGRAFLGM